MVQLIRGRIRRISAWFAYRGVSQKDTGASLVEYALILALIVIVCIATITVIGETTSSKFARADKCFEGAVQCNP